MSMLVTANTHGAVYATHAFHKRIGWPLGIVFMALQWEWFGRPGSGLEVLHRTRRRSPSHCERLLRRRA